MQKITMDVSKKVNGKYQKVGAVEINVPVLHDLFSTVEIQKDDKGNDLVEDGLPVYKDDKHNYVQGAIFAAVKAQARNKLVSGTAELKAGQKIAATWEELTAEGERVGNGEALAAVREAKAAFAEHVKTLGKSKNAQDTLNLLFGNKQALSVQSAENKAKMEGYVTDFAEKLATDAPDQFSRFEKYITGILASCAATEDAEDF